VFRSSLRLLLHKRAVMPFRIGVKQSPPLAIELVLFGAGSVGAVGFFTLADGLARLCERRGAILLFIIPLAIVRLALHPLFPEEHSWADFFVQMSFFLLGYLLFSQQEFLHAVRRDARICLAAGAAAAASALAIAVTTGSLDLQAPPRTWLDTLFWLLIAVDSWCWTLFFLAAGMRYLNYTNRYLEYGQGAVLPFFVLHQPVIIVMAYYAVQWQANLIVKLLFVVIGSFCVSWGIYEFLIRRVGPLRRMFGMKPAAYGGMA
jgi:hypothetical protein